MPFYRTRVTINSSTGDTADRVNLTQGWSTSATPAALVEDFRQRFETLATAPEAGFESLASIYATGYKPAFYEVFDAQGGPALAVAPTPGIWTTTGTGAGPHEVALVATYLITSARGPAPKGRNYFGPFASARIQFPRPATTTMNAILSFADRLRQNMEDSYQHTQVVLNAAGTIAWPIIGTRVDDAWDTQRRRGLAPLTSVQRVDA